jgi:hypothetical protein
LSVQFLIGPTSVGGQWYGIANPPECWETLKGGIPACTECGKTLRLEFDGPEKGVARCKCEDAEGRSFYRDLKARARASRLIQPVAAT